MKNLLKNQSQRRKEQLKRKLHKRRKKVKNNLNKRWSNRKTRELIGKFTVKMDIQWLPTMRVPMVRVVSHVMSAELQA